MPARRLQALYRLRDLKAELARQRQSGLLRYYHDPAGFARDLIVWRPGEHLAGYQAETLTALATHRRVAVRGPHGLGKTTEKAIAILWFATTRDAAEVDWKIPTTAGVWRQLTEFLWPEVHKWAARLRWDLLGRDPFDRRQLLDLHLVLQHGRAYAVAAKDPALIEGAHADSLLYIYDEAKSIPDPIWDAAEGAFAGGRPDGLPEAYALAGSTPGEPQGRFYQIHARNAGFEDWWTRHVTLAEAKAAGRISQAWEQQRRVQWAGTPALIQTRVEGEFAASGTDGVIPLAWAEQAVDRWHDWHTAGQPDQHGLQTVGVDVARGGADQTVLALRDGWVITRIDRPAHTSTMPIVGHVVGLRRGRPTMLPVVDVVGIGAGVVDRLREQGEHVDAFNAGAHTPRRDRSGELGFANVRSAAWWNLRELLDPSSGQPVALPPDDLLIGDLTAPTWRLLSGGRIQVESKDDIRRRLGRSTDTADAVIQAFWPQMVTARLAGAEQLAAVHLG